MIPNRRNNSRRARLYRHPRHRRKRPAAARRAAFAAALMLALWAAWLPTALAASQVTVAAGDSLWKIALANGLTVARLKELNGLTSDTIYPGQTLNVEAPSADGYTVCRGDSLWAVARRFGVTVAALKSANGLSGDTIYPGQRLILPAAAPAADASGNPRPAPVVSWPSVTYSVKSGDTVGGIAARFGVTQAQIVRFNYLAEGEWLNEGQKIAINGYAPRNYAVTPGESASPARTGKLVDWFLDGQYLINRGDVLLITDAAAGLRFTARVLGGFNHADVEPLTTADTAVMKKLFPSWTWTPRPVVIYHRGINFAASLSGMPHSFDTIANNVAGHFDMYLWNSKGHSSTSAMYVGQHQNCVRTAAGLE